MVFPKGLFFFLIYLLAALGLRCHAGFSLVAASGGYSSVQCTSFSFGGFSSREALALGAGASVVVARVGSAVAAPRLQSTGSLVVEGLSCSAACGISPNRGFSPCLLALASGLLPSEPPAPERFFFFFLMSCHSAKG